MAVAGSSVGSGQETPATQRSPYSSATNVLDVYEVHKVLAGLVCLLSGVIGYYVRSPLPLVTLEPARVPRIYHYHT